MKRVKSSVELKKRLRSRHLVAFAVLALGIGSIVMFFWMRQINKRGDTDLLIADAIMDLEVNVASSHFKLEESYFKHIPGAEERALADLDHAINRANALLTGGKSKFGPDLLVLKNSSFSMEAKSIVSMLSEMKRIAQRLVRVPAQAPFPEDLDERFDQICDQVLSDAKSLELEFEKREFTHRKASRNLVYLIFFAWSGVVAGSTIGLWNRERQRKNAEAAILSLNDDLETRTKELIRHRENCMDLVEERTARLKLANEELSAEVAERQEMEKALRVSEEKYRMLIETMDEGLTILDENGMLVYINDKFCEMLGRSRNEILGRPISKFMANDQEIAVATEYQQNISSQVHGRLEAAFFRKDGNIAFTITSLKGIRDTTGKVKGCFAVITDITEKLALQENSLRTAHLASLGEIAAGVAHEINNPINGIINYACILLEGRNDPELEKEIAARIQMEGRRIAGIVRDLLLFGRAGIKEKLPVNINEVLSKSLYLIDKGLEQDGIKIRTYLAPDLPMPVIDPQELQRVFINIINNAKYALNQKYPANDENKTLDIRTLIACRDNENFVRIEFEDSGEGIPAGVIGKIKQPFFSTRPKGKGTGLGLSISDGIVSECGGSLTIESKQGEFTRVKIDLPVAVDSDSHPLSAKPGKTVKIRGS